MCWSLAGPTGDAPSTALVPRAKQMPAAEETGALDREPGGQPFGCPRCREVRPSLTSRPCESLLSRQALPSLHHEYPSPSPW